MTANVTNRPTKPSARYANLTSLTASQVWELYNEMADMPESTHRAFYLRHIKGKKGAF
jgi:hypothetical protein